MTTINSERFAEICSEVWQNRAAVLERRGFLSGEAALVRAVYWRLCNSGLLPASSTENYGSPQTVSTYQLGVDRLLKINGDPLFDCSPFLEDLLQRYENDGLEY